MKKADWAALILLGGKSSRMGEDKAFVKWQGKTFLNHTLDLLTPFNDEIYLSVNADQHQLLKSDHHCIPDKFEDKGPLGGILSTMECANKDLLVIPIDMPLLSANLLRPLIEQAELACYQIDGNIEPFPSFWPSSLVKSIKDSMHEYDLSVKAFLKKNRVQFLRSGQSEVFRNFNFKEDLNLSNPRSD